MQVYGEDLPQSITTVPPQVVASMFSALKKRHPGLVNKFDFSAVDEADLEVHLIILLQSMLEKGTDYAGEALTDEQRQYIHTYSRAGRCRTRRTRRTRWTRRRTRERSTPPVLETGDRG